MSANIKYIILFLCALCILAFLFFPHLFSGGITEGFDDLEPIEYQDEAQTKIKYGYYKIDDQYMRKIPYGYEIDPQNNMRILAKTQAERYKLYGGNIGVEKYKEGEKLADGYYMTDRGEVAILPPNMMPNVSDVSYGKISPDNSYPVLSISYNAGYVTKEEYYRKQFNAPSDETVGVPPTMYFVDFSKRKVAFLPEGKIANTTQGYGYIDNPRTETGKKNDYGGVDMRMNYLDISNNYDFSYHINEQEMVDKMNSGVAKGDLGGYNSIMVRDKYGNLVRLGTAGGNNSLLGIDGEIVYYTPGTSKYGMSNYIPDYVESQLLKNNLGLLSVAKYTDSKTKSAGFCEVNKHSPVVLDEKCNSLDGNVCASTSCCVLFGGEKCVAGDKNGPHNKSHYTDIFVKNKDFYYYDSKCYGNCER